MSDISIAKYHVPTEGKLHCLIMSHPLDGGMLRPGPLAVHLGASCTDKLRSSVLREHLKGVLVAYIELIYISLQELHTDC